MKPQKMANDLLKGIKLISKHYRTSVSGKLKDESSQKFILQLKSELSNLLDLAYDFGAKEKGADLVKKELERLLTKIPKRDLERIKRYGGYDRQHLDEVEEGYEDEDYEADFDEMVGEDEEYEERQNPREKSFNFTQSKKAQIVKDCIQAMEEEDLANRNDATRFMYDWLKENDYQKGDFAPIGILSPLFKYIEENYEE